MDADDQPSRRDRQVTLQDVAGELGLSCSTVSRALNNKGRVSERTRQRVLDVARMLDYRPSVAARSLATQKTTNLGFLVCRQQVLSEGSFYGEVMEGAASIARAGGYRLVFSTNAVEDALHLIAEERVDGMVLAGCRLPHDLILRLNSHLPIVLVDNHLDGIDSVAIDNGGGGAQAVARLVGLGHDRIGFVCETLDNLSFLERLEGYKRGLDEHGILYDDALVSEGVAGAECGYVATTQLLQHARPTAIFAANDEAAAGTIRVLNEAGLSVPEDVAVVGFDDGTLAQHVVPALTSVRVFREAMGRWAAKRLIDLVEKSDSPAVQIRVSTKLIIRRSCGARRPEHPKPAKESEVMTSEPRSVSPGYEVSRVQGGCDA